MPFLEKNREILLSQYPGLYEDICINNDEILPDDLKVETASTGELTLTVKGIYVHSPRDPEREGQRLVEAAGGQSGPIVILGFGLGYAAQAAAGLGRPIIIVEKYKSLFLKALELRDYSSFFSSNKIIFIVGGSGDGIVNALAIADELVIAESGGQSADDKKNAHFIIRNRALISLDEQSSSSQLWYKSIEDKIRSYTMKDDVNMATHKRFGYRWVRNLTRNMSSIRDIPGISHLASLAFEEGNNSLPVFLAAAGPSLDKIKPLLHSIYDRCIIVAVDTSLRFFVNNGIHPDFVLVVDPQFWNTRHLDRCLCRETCMQTALIAEPAVYPPVLSLPFKNKFLCSSLFPLGTFIEKQVDLKGRLAAGGSVATTAWDFAHLLGAQEIWIAGLDLAFPDLKTHFRGARFEEQANSMSNRFNPIEKWIVRALRDGFPFIAPCGNGGQVLTDRRLSLYAAWFENQFCRNSHVKNYSLFQDGLAIAGLQAADTEKFLAMPKRRDEIDSRISNTFAQIYNKFNDPQEKEERVIRYGNAVSSLKNGLESIRDAACEGAEIARRALRYPLSSQQQNKILKELDEITRRITESEVKEVAGFLIPAVNEKKSECCPDENHDPFCAYLKSSLDLYTGIMEAGQITVG